MGLKKKKNIVTLTLLAATCFFIYQVYFLVTFLSESSTISPFLDSHAVDDLKKLARVRSEADKYINEHGLIRGVLRQHILKYRPNSKNQFKCLKSEQLIPFEWVNDDYCDCDDGSDEPSTSACPNGQFYCDTQRAKLIAFHKVPSSRINDGICDCCDGSDEWELNNKQSHLSSKNMLEYVKCPNKCNS